jgi:hypothetical protein
MKDIAIIAVIYFIVYSGMNLTLTYRNLLKEAGWTTHSISVAKAQEVKELSPYEQVIKILNDKGVDENFKKNFLCLIRNESNFNPEASSAVKLATGKISVDRGITQVNSQVAPYKITNACAYDLKCSVEKAIDYLRETNKWQKWYGWLHNCQNN